MEEAEEEQQIQNNSGRMAIVLKHDEWDEDREAREMMCREHRRLRRGER
jgi:hypothetical protein